MRAKRPSVLRGIITGAAAGISATLIMDQFFKLPSAGHKAVEKQRKLAQGESPWEIAHEQVQQEQQAAQQEDSTEILARKIATATGKTRHKQQQQTPAPPAHHPLRPPTRAVPRPSSHPAPPPPAHEPAASAQQSPHPPTTPPQTKPPVVPPGPTAVIDTPMGRLTCKLFEKEAPITAANFIGLAEGTKDWTDPKTLQKMHHQPFYNGTSFHRVIPTFMIQGGDRAGDGTGDPGYFFQNEIDPNLTFDQPGLLAIANAGPGPAS